MCWIDCAPVYFLNYARCLLNKLTQRSFVLFQQVSVVEADDFEHLDLVQMDCVQVMNQHSH